MPQNPTDYDINGKPIYGYDVNGNPQYSPPTSYPSFLDQAKSGQFKPPSPWQGHLLKWRDPTPGYGEQLKKGFLEGLPKVELTSPEDYPGAKSSGLAGAISRASRYPVGALASIYNKVAGITSPINIAATGASLAFPEAAPYIFGGLASYGAAQAPRQIYDAFQTEGKTPFQNFENATDAALSVLGPAIPATMMYRSAHAPAVPEFAPAMAEAPPQIQYKFRDMPRGIAGLLGPGSPEPPAPTIDNPVPAAQNVLPKLEMPARTDTIPVTIPGGFVGQAQKPNFGGLRLPAAIEEKLQPGLDMPVVESPAARAMRSLVPDRVLYGPETTPGQVAPKLGAPVPLEPMQTGNVTAELGPPASQELVMPGKITRSAEAVRNIDASMGKTPAPVPTRETLINYDDKPFVRPTTETPKPIQTAAEKSPDPEVRATAGTMVAENERAAKTGESAQKISEWKTAVTHRGIQLLRTLSPEAANLIEKAQTDSAILAAKWTQKIRQNIEGLNGTEQKLLQQALDGAIKPEALPQNLQAPFEALRQMSAPDGEYVTMAQQAGLDLVKRSGDRTLFKGIKNYWRRKPTPEWLEGRQSAIQDIMNAYQAEGESLTRNQAENLLYNAMKYGEKIKGFQHQRQWKSDVPYRTDLSVLYEDAIEKAERIIQAKYFGPKDINDKTSPLTIAAESSKNPDVANRIIRRMLNRDSDPHMSDSQNLQKLSAAMSVLKLGKIAISNMAPSMTNAPAMFPLTENLRALGQLIKDPSVIGDFGERAGIDVAFLRNLTKDVGTTNYLNRVYGFKASEVGPRKFTAWIARSTADHLFSQLKENPQMRGADRAKAQLKYLTLEDPDRLLSQSHLSDQQLLRAGYRGQAMVHGMAGTGDVPIEWSKAPGWAKLALQFKKFSYNSAANTKDMVKMGGPATLGKLILFGTLAGELLGDVKMGLVGAVSGPMGGENPLEQIKNRGVNGPTGNFYADRELSNLTNAWTAGILLDLFSAATRQGGLVEMAGGPTIGTAANVAAHTWQAGKNAVRNGWNGGQTIKPVARDLFMNLPLPGGIGQGIYEGLYPPER